MAQKFPIELTIRELETICSALERCGAAEDHQKAVQYFGNPTRANDAILLYKRLARALHTLTDSQAGS